MRACLKSSASKSFGQNIVELGFVELGDRDRDRDLGWVDKSGKSLNQDR